MSYHTFNNHKMHLFSMFCVCLHAESSQWQYIPRMLLIVCIRQMTIYWYVTDSQVNLEFFHCQSKLTNGIFGTLVRIKNAKTALIVKYSGVCRLVVARPQPVKAKLNLRLAKTEWRIRQHLAAIKRMAWRWKPRICWEFYNWVEIWSGWPNHIMLLLFVIISIVSRYN